MARLLFSVQVEGRDNLPARGGLIVAGLPHRNWAEPFLLLGLLPRRPVWIADGKTASTSRWRRWVAARAGGVIAVSTNPRHGSFERTSNEVSAALDRHAIVAIFPEVGPPSRPPQVRRLSPGLANLAARAGAEVMPIAFGGTHELYLRRRIVIRILPAMDPPEETSRAATRHWMAQFEEMARQAAAEVDELAAASAPRWKVGRWLTGRYPRAD